MKSSLRMGTVAAAVIITAPLYAQADPEALRQSSTSLEAEFRSPPNAARPRVWWHWISGNVDSEGAKLDMEWMRRAGIGGFHVFSGDMRAPTVVPKRQPFMSEGWMSTLREAVRLAHPAGMEIGIAGSPGWSHTGGPWVAPADGMKKYVWSETRVEGGTPFNGLLAAPPSVTGPFQDLPGGKSRERDYRDSYVVAFPTPASELNVPRLNLTSSDETVDLASLQSGEFTAKVRLAAGGLQGFAWVQANYTAPVSISAVTLGLPKGANVEVLASNDGKIFRLVATSLIESPEVLTHPLVQQTFAIPETRTRFIRIVLRPVAQPAALPMGPGPQPKAPPPASIVEISKVAFHAAPRVDRFEAKAGFQPSLTGDRPGMSTASGAIPLGRVLDITEKLDRDGRLTWTPPKGEWTVLRFGWSLTGQVNGPAEREATGLEVDKLDAGAVRRYIDHYLGMYEKATGGLLGANGIQTVLTDSWEAGVQNWTPAMRAEFRKRRGYDLVSFMPVLAGRVVESATTSDRFLWDYRQTLKELVADNHHAVLADAIHSRGMTFYTEAQGDTPRAIADGMTLKSRSDIPTAEYWFRPFAAGPGQFSLKADMEEAASAAHIYGKPLAAAEAFTVAAMSDPWAFSPRMLKPVADEIFVRGINRIIVHDSHHQPLVDKKPGLMLGIFGQFFNRNDTWAEDAKPWVDYLARTSHLLQQGHFVADVAYYYGEERNLTELFRDRLNTDVPQGYRYDYINREALLTLLSVKDGRIVTPSGMSYGVLYMPEHVTRFTLPAIRKIRELVAAGAVIVGPKPTGGLGYESPDAAVRAIADKVWGAGSSNGHKFGDGMTYADTALPPVLIERGIAPDISFTAAAQDAQLLALHRRTADADIYFITNQLGRVETVEASFRIKGKMPELWRAETGEVQPLSYRLEGERVVSPLRLAPHDAVFVVFRRSAEAPSWTAPEKQERILATLSGPWPISFEPGRGAPPSATFETLLSWPESPDTGIRYFSGAATYSKNLMVPARWVARGMKIELDLGDVRELATVSVNGKPVATVWHSPYRVDVTNALHTGNNRIEIKVVNLWPNRLIGDKQAGAAAVAFAPQARYGASSPLLPSGLLGPVRLVANDE